MAVLAAATRHLAIGDVRGRGLVIGVDLVADRERRTPATELATRVCRRAADLGVALFHVGHHANVLELTPPLTITAEEVDTALGILDQALGDAGA